MRHELSIRVKSGVDHPLLDGRTGLPVLFSDEDLLAYQRYNTGPIRRAMEQVSLQEMETDYARTS